ncbi:MAG: hypothetical protein U1E76_22695 [Planctomycetota bacterium]
MDDALPHADHALRALRRNIMRAVLTTLGIIIGVAAVIVMMEIGSLVCRWRSRAPSTAWEPTTCW